VSIASRTQVRKSLRLSVLDGSAYAAMLGLTQNYVTPLALALKATTAQVGLLFSVPSLTMALSQLAAPDLSERAGSRKGFILPVVFMHAIMFVPVLLVPFVFHASQVWWLIVFITIGAVFGSIANPAWGSMMADLVPVRLRGRYFGSRGRIAGLITLVFSFAAGWVLQALTGNIFAGFAVLFGGAAVFRLLSLNFLSRMYEPEQIAGREKGPGLVQMIRQVGSSNLGRFTLYFALIDFCTCISAPFFAVFMLRDLSFNYATFVIVNSSSAVSSLLFQPFWGRRADIAGNIRVIRITSVVLPVIPLLWLVSHNIFYLLAANVVSGFAWSGFSLASVNFVYDASEPHNRTKQIALFNATDGVAVCLGALLGGYLVPHLPFVLGYQLRNLFAVSGVLRAVVVILLLKRIVEVRRVPGMTSFQVLLRRSGKAVSGRGVAVAGSPAGLHPAFKFVSNSKSRVLRLLRNRTILD
jgi:MFS family permease